MKKRIIILPAAWTTEKVFLPQIEHLQNEYELFFPNIHQFNTVLKMADYIIQNYKDVYAVIGLSMGGYIAQEILIQAPDFCSKVVLIGVDSYALPNEAKNFLSNIIEQVREEKLDELLDLYAKSVLAPESLQDASLLNYVKQLPLNLSTAELINHHQACIAWEDSKHKLKNIKAEALILIGEKDACIPLDNAKILEKNIANSMLKVLQNAGHFLTLESSEKVNKILFEFLA